MEQQSFRYICMSHGQIKATNDDGTFKYFEGNAWTFSDDEERPFMPLGPELKAN